MIGYFVRHPTAANLLMLIIILLGLLGMSSLTREVFPEFASEYINVQVIYRGASAEEVEDTICRRIEEEIEGIEGIEEANSTSRENSAFVIIEVADGYQVRDVLQDVENAVEQIDDFPKDVEDPVIWEWDQPEPVCTLSLWAQQMSEKDLAALADEIEGELLALEGVSLVEVTGFTEHEIRIEVREEDLLAHGLTIGDVGREISAQSVDLPAGSVETDEREITIRVVDQRRWAEDFRDLIVKVSPEGARIALRDVATVTDTFEEEWTQATLEGKRCANLGIFKTRPEDSIQVAKAVRDYIQQREQSLPPGVHLTMWGDYSSYVAERLGMLVQNGAMGFVLVFLTLWLFLHFRLAIWVAVGIPLSFLGTLFMMEQIDMTLNMITMFALIMALGIIVDDAIVIGENIFAHYCRGESAVEAAVGGTKEVGLGVIASMLTTIAVFMPLLAMKGDVGKVLRVMPIGVIAALSVSLIEAFLVLPHHLSHSLKKMPPQPSRFRAATDRSVRWLTEQVYGPALRWSVRRPLIPVAGVIVLFLVALGMLVGGWLKFQIFPELDGDFLVAQVELPAGTDFSRTQEVVRRIEKALVGKENVEDDAAKSVNEYFRPRQPDKEGEPGKKDDLVRYVSTTFGFGRPTGHDPGEPQRGSHVAQVVVELLPADQRGGRCDEILQEWRERVGEIPDVVNLTFEQAQVTPGGKAIDVRLRGSDLRRLQEASQELRDKLETYPGVYNVRDNLHAGKEEVLVRLKPAALPLGITSEALALQLREAFWGHIAEEFQRGPDMFEVRVLFAPEDRRSLGDLDDFEVRTPDGRMVPFLEVATAELERGFSQIVRIDGRRTISVTADLDTFKGNAVQIVADLQQTFRSDFLKRHPGVSIDFEGQSKEAAETGASLQRGFIIGVCIIFILLSFVFQSYLEPLIVMAAIPFGLIGAVGGHLLLGLQWTMPSTVGFVSLSGIVVNDSILLVNFIKLRLAEGKSVPQAIHEAGMQRFRPVVLTSATTVAGLFPIMIETSLQAQFLIPMAVSISFGLLFATVIVLLLVPCLYSILSWLGWSQKIEVSRTLP